MNSPLKGPPAAHAARGLPMTGLPPAAPIHQLHHYAYRARDAEETRHFYEDILGLPLYHIIQSDYVPRSKNAMNEPSCRRKKKCVYGQYSPVLGTWSASMMWYSGRPRMSS